MLTGGADSDHGCCPAVRWLPPLLLVVLMVASRTPNGIAPEARVRSWYRRVNDGLGSLGTNNAAQSLVLSVREYNIHDGAEAPEIEICRHLSKFRELAVFKFVVKALKRTRRDFLMVMSEPCVGDACKRPTCGRPS